MSKKETRRAARQAFPGGPPTVQRRDHVRGTKPQPTSKKKPGVGNRRPPSVKRAAIQGAILAALYLILIRFIWKEDGSNAATYILFPAIAFVAYTVVAYFLDKYMYQRSLRKLKDQSK
jgi:phosphatidylglycerophosphate synthase